MPEPDDADVIFIYAITAYVSRAITKRSLVDSVFFECLHENTVELSGSVRLTVSFFAIVITVSLYIFIDVCYNETALQ